MPALSNVTTTGPSAAVDFKLPRSGLQLTASWTGSPSSVVVTLEGSMDNAVWTTLAAVTYPAAGQTAASAFSTAPGAPGSSAYCHSPAITGGSAQSTGSPARYVRANLTNLSGGTLPTVSAWITAVGNDNNGP